MVGGGGQCIIEDLLGYVFLRVVQLFSCHEPHVCHQNAFVLFFFKKFGLPAL